ncbi:hypothetical protein Droror1_Dr00015357 [Drosera rotundifolia]
MGCSASKLDILHTTAPPPQPSSPSAKAKTRSVSAPLVHHYPLKKGDTHHLVSLTSTTYGSLFLLDRIPATGDRSKEEKPCSPDSVINTWELMEGLDDDEGLEFEVGAKDDSVICNGLELMREVGDGFVFVEKEDRSGKSKKPLWKHLTEESMLSNMDENVASSYERALSSRKLGFDLSSEGKSMVSTPSPRTSFCVLSNGANSSPVMISSLCSTKTTETMSSGTSICSMETETVSSMSSFCSAKSEMVSVCEDRIVFYYTSLRGIRRTYEDCCVVRMIFRGLRVPVDERDISLDSTYKKALQEALKGKPLSLPQVFIGEKHIGGAEEIKQMHEYGELAKLVVGFPVQDYGLVCEGCGDARFVPCPSCNGSRKVFVEEEDRLRRCADCNENGLIRCPACGY